MLADRSLDPGEARRRATELLGRVGLGDRLNHHPAQLSGGEQQRVGIARAFANRPRVLFADEPTGNLDRHTGNEVAELLLAVNRELGTTLLVVTHDLAMAARANRALLMEDGRIVRRAGRGELREGPTLVPPPEPAS